MFRLLSLTGALLTTVALAVTPTGPASASAAPPPAAPVAAASPCDRHGPLPASWDSRWKNGLDVDLDIAIIGEDIISYQIQWSNGSWSDIYFPGQNDVDWVDSNRRVWSYFYDHAYAYLSCPIG